MLCQCQLVFSIIEENTLHKLVKITSKMKYFFFSKTKTKINQLDLEYTILVNMYHGNVVVKIIIPLRQQREPKLIL